MTSESQLMDRIRLLNDQQIDELRLFVEFLLSKPLLQPKTGAKSLPPLQGLQRVPVPVNNIIIDRADIYEDRVG